MKICVAGLGIIGGSLCMALKRAGYFVAGWNRSKRALDYALDRGMIDERAENFDYDVIFVALPPKAAAEFIDVQKFKKGCIVSDICGVKGYILDAVRKRARSFRYVGCHPMAGKEVSGIENASESLFDKANMVIVKEDDTDEEALQTVEKLTKDLGFKYLVECSAALHDAKISYTSQLAHIVSNCYVKNEQIDDCIRFTGGSFQDMTRIAGVDEQVWADLYLLNSKNLCENIENLTEKLNEIKEAIAGGNREKLVNLLRSGRERFEKSKNFVENCNIIVRKLK